MYSKTNRFFEFNKQRREQGRIPVPCVWPDCQGHVLAREHPPTKNTPYVKYRVDSGRLAGLVRYPICESHRARLFHVFGRTAKLNGIKAIVYGQTAERSGRVSAPMTRLVIFDKTHGHCAHCVKSMIFSDRWHADHVIPLFKGGLTNFSNMQALCTACHDVKSKSEKIEANALRYGDQRNWASKHQLLKTVSDLRLEVSRLKVLLAQYVGEEEMAG